MNIQRGRDHSIATYNDVREACEMSSLPDSFGEDYRPPEIPQYYWKKFETLYVSPKDIELFPAGMSETPVSDGIVGPTFACVISNQFKNLKYSDR